MVGIDLSAAHVAAACTAATSAVQVLQGALRDLHLPRADFDVIWCVNTINHFNEPLDTIKGLATWLRPDGRILLRQNSLLSDMYLASDARLERLTTEAVRRYYRERYRLNERDLTAVRAIASLLRRAGRQNVTART